MSRMKITNHGSSACTIEYNDFDTDLRQVRTFTAPAAGGYVREIFDPMKDGPQVCEQLAHAGVTLMWHPEKGDLSEMIRREYKSMRRAEASEDA